MQITSPSRLGDIQSGNKWTAVCSICWHWSSGENKKQAREHLRHHVRCKYISVDEDRVKEIRPKTIR
ncbi:MAG: hypothetical protein WBV92_02265 [Nitrosotalea sp.]